MLEVLIGVMIGVIALEFAYIKHIVGEVEEMQEFMCEMKNDLDKVKAAQLVTAARHMENSNKVVVVHKWDNTQGPTFGGF